MDKDKLLITPITLVEENKPVRKLHLTRDNNEIKLTEQEIKELVEGLRFFGYYLK